MTSEIETEWERVRYDVPADRVAGADLHDGEYQVRLEIAGTAPAFLSDWGFVQMRSESNGFMVVRLGVGIEPSGIQALGGPASSQP